MKLSDAKREFISAWGIMGTSWNITRAMAEMHALLLITEQPMSADDMMEYLSMSRGTVNQNIRELMSWNLVYKKHIAGERREFFTAEKDLWTIASIVIRERKRMELEPVIKSVQTLSKIEETTAEAKRFSAQMKEIKDFANHASSVLSLAESSDKNWFFLLLKKLIK